MTADVIQMAPGQGVVYSRALATPMTGWVPEIGPVTITGERSLYGHVFQMEIVQLSTGIKSVVDARAIFRGENVVALLPRPRDGQQAELFRPSDTEPPAA
jgi:hypothetical protein